MNQIADKTSESSEKVIFVTTNDIDNNSDLIFNKIKSYYFEGDLKLKFDMTMILTPFFKRKICH